MLVFVLCEGLNPIDNEIERGKFCPLIAGELIFLINPPSQYFFLSPAMIPKSTPIPCSSTEPYPLLPSPLVPEEEDCSQI